MSNKLFISYCHQQINWVRERLVPCLRAGGAEVLIDFEQFTAGKPVIGQMDETQDSAGKNLLILAPEYLSSDFCLHEMNRALGRGDVAEGTVIPIIRRDCVIPNEIKKLLYINLIDDRDDRQWKMLLKACQIDLGTDAPHWLKVRDDICVRLNRNESVNLVVSGNVKWRELIDDISNNHMKDLKILDLQAGRMSTRHSFIEELLHACNILTPVPPEPNDLVFLDRSLPMEYTSRLAIVHWDMISYYPHFDIPLFAALRNLMESRRVVLLAQSKTPLLQLLPSNHPLSSIVSTNFELKGR